MAGVGLDGCRWAASVVRSCPADREDEGIEVACSPGTDPAFLAVDRNAADTSFVCLDQLGFG